MGFFTKTDIERLGPDLLDRLPLGISVYRLEAPGDPRAFRLTYTNAASGRLTGLDPAAEVGRMLVDVVPNIGETGVLEAYLAVLASGEPRDLGTIEYGDDRIETTSYGIRAIPLGPDRLAILFEDVSERAEVQALRATQAELHREEARYRSLVEATAAIVWTTPPSGEFGADQERWRTFTGQSVEESMGWGWLEAVHPDDREDTAAAWSEALAQRGLYEVKHRLRGPDGAYQRMSARAAPVRGEAGEVVEWVGAHTDIEGERRAAAALRDSEARFRTLLNAIGDALLVYPIGPEGAEPFVAFNEAALARYGYSDDELRGLTVADLLEGDDGAGHEAALEELRRTRGGTFQAVHRTKAGDRLFVSTHARVVEYDGRLCVVALCRDDAAGRQFRREIARSNRLLEEAVAERTHQLEAFSEDLKILHGITTAEHPSAQARFEAYLRAGCEMFELPVGILASTPLDPDTGQTLYRLDAVVATDPALQPGLTVPITDAFCDAVVAGQQTVAYGDALEDAPQHPACVRHGFRAYIGSAVTVDGVLHGTLSFLSPEARPQGFTDSERDLVEVMTQAVGRQITLDRAERERAEAEALHRSVLAAAAEGIYGLDRDGRTTFVNPAGVALTGWPADEQIGSRQHDLIHHHHADGAPFPAETCRIYQTLRDGHPRAADDEVFWRKDGTALPVAYVVTPILDEGEVTGAVVTFSERAAAG